MSRYWAYIHAARVWTAWLYVDGQIVEKLGSFDSKQELIEAKDRFEQEIKDG